MSADLPNKRQRHTGSFSPASPPYHLSKPAGPTDTTIDQQPNTPTSPPYMSSTTQSQPYASLSSTQAPGLTPPSVTASASSQQNTINTFPTPASSAEMSSFTSKGADGNAQMPDDQMEGITNAPTRDVHMGGDSSHMHTGHDRQGTGSSASEDVGLDRLKAGSSPFYKLSETPYPISRPHASENLLAAYGLNRIAQSVARFDPVTGEKINKLRKSYEGHIKGFQIAGGKNKPEAVEGQLGDLLEFPDEEWYSQKVFGKELEKGVDSSLLEKLNRAVKMQPGKLPGDEATKWKSRIGTDDGLLKKSAPELSDATAKKIRPVGQGPGQGRLSAAPSPSMKPARPDRAGKKRSYVESSFKGYGEGFVDDDPMGESTGGEDEGKGGLKKKRRKDFAAGSPLAFNNRRGSYQPGMVGVRH